MNYMATIKFTVEKNAIPVSGAIIRERQCATRISYMCSECKTDISSTYVSGSQLLCKPCLKQYHQNYRKENAERIATLKKQWANENIDHKKAKDKAYAIANPDKRAQARAKWDANNPGATSAAKKANYAARIKRIPSWLSEDDKWMIAQAYDIAKVRTAMFGFPWHVDHIIPLKGRNVSGLHVPCNLQVIPGADNLRKSNVFSA